MAGDNKGNTASSNGQALRDKLNTSLKARLAKKSDVQGAGRVATVSTSVPVSAPNIAKSASSPRAKAITRDDSFLDELEHEARREVGLIPSGAANAEPLPPIPPFTPPHLGLSDPEVPEVPEVPESMSMPSTPDNSWTEDGDAPTQPSLLNLLKKNKPDLKKSSALKSPRQSAAMGTAPETDPVELPQAASKKDSFLKHPRTRSAGFAPAPSANETPPEPAPVELSHEQEIFEALKRGDNAWIFDHARLQELPQMRQEILLIYALPNLATVRALLDAGLHFNGVDGLALRAAVAKKNYPALEMLKTKGARIDLDTLTHMAAWHRQQARGMLPSTEPPVTAASPEKLQQDFDQFLAEHAMEIGRDDIDAFTPTPTSTPPIAAATLDEHSYLNSDLVPKTLLSPVRHFSMPGEQDFQATEPSEPPTPVDPQSAAKSAFVPTPEEFDTSELVTESSIMSAPTPPLSEPRKAGAPVSVISAMDRARLSMLDKVLAEKQQLEMRLMELQMYAEAASSLEEERDRLAEELVLARETSGALSTQLEEVKLSHAHFSSDKAVLESQIARLVEDTERNREDSRQERDRLLQAESNLSSLLRESERRESELRVSCSQLNAKIAELEKREAPAPEATDWLKGTEREASLRKQMFIEAVIKGEHRSLDKISKNTALETETAHMAFVFAAEAGQLKSAQWIIENLDVHPGFGGEIALLRALDGKHYDMVRWLASHGSDIHYADEFALRFAVDKNDVTMLDFLVSMGANPRVSGDRPLCEAARKLSWSCFKALLGYGCTGQDHKGDVRPEILEQEESAPLLQWAQDQRKIQRSLDPDFAKRQTRVEL